MFSSQFRGFLRQSAIRQALGLLAVFALISSIAWGANYWLVKREINRLVDARLSAQMADAITALQNSTSLPSPGFGQSIALVIVDQITQGTTPPALHLLTTSDGYFDADAGTPNEPDYRYLVRTTASGRVVVSENVERQDELYEVLLIGLQVALLGSLGTALLTGLFIARRNQARFDLISDGLAKVAQGNLSTRIDLPDHRDDLSLLANRIDATTQRLEQSVEQIRVQSSNIAHDLRTPLARLRVLIESRYLALLDKKEPVAAESLETALAQIDRIVGTFDALLRIVRIESGARKSSFTKFSLEEVAQSVDEAFGPVVEEAGQTLMVSMTKPAQIHGDQDLLIQLLANLLQNALRYGSANQTITLTVHGRQISVSDEGPGIPFAERDKVLEPLHQLEEARQGEGFGLGLALVRAIAELHDASLTLSDGPNRRGLSVTLRFPKNYKIVNIGKT